MTPEQIASAWTWRGQARPPFAEVPAPGHESVWDYPRPPALRPDSREVVVVWDGHPVARTTNAIRLLETSHPPTWYLPLADIDASLLAPAGGGSTCEWKGPATYWSLVRPGARLDRVAWSYPRPLPGAAAIAGHLAFYAHHLQATVDGMLVRPQDGGFYGGWITPDLAGPFKGGPGTMGW